jgi:glycerol-3-phosphate cytidylyltransferase-like family protein
VKGAAPRRSAAARARQLEAEPNIDEVVLGNEHGYIDHIMKAQPDIIALGYDQEGEFVDHLADDLAAAGSRARIVRLQPYEPETYKTSKLRK